MPQGARLMQQLDIVFNINLKGQEKIAELQKRLTVGKILHPKRKYKRERLEMAELKYEQQMNKTKEASLKKQVYQANRFRMEYLGIMFAGMQANRAIMSFLKSTFKAYNDAFEETSKMEKITNRLTAAWKFFQFALVDALTQSSLFKSAIDMIAGFLDKISAMDVDNLIKMAYAFMAIAALAGALFLIGQSVLAWSSIKLAVNMAAFTKAVGGIGATSTGLGAAGGAAATGGIGTLAGLALAGIVIKIGWDIFTSGDRSLSETLARVGLGLLGIGIIVGTGGAATLPVVLVFGLGGNAIAKLLSDSPIWNLIKEGGDFAKDTFGGAWDNAVAAFGLLKSDFDGIEDKAGNISSELMSINMTPFADNMSLANQSMADISTNSTDFADTLDVDVKPVVVDAVNDMITVEEEYNGVLMDRLLILEDIAKAKEYIGYAMGDPYPGERDT